MLTPPTLETDRLRLRLQRYSDWPDYRDIMASSRAKFMGGPFAEREAWGMFCHDLAQWSLFGHGALTIDCRQTATAVGQVAINDGPLFPEKELGWYLYGHGEGLGYAQEAAECLRDWAFVQLDISTLVSYIDPGNHRSCRLAERMGAVLDPSAATPEPGTLAYRHRRR